MRHTGGREEWCVDGRPRCFPLIHPFALTRISLLDLLLVLLIGLLVILVLILLLLEQRLALPCLSFCNLGYML